MTLAGPATVLGLAVPASADRPESHAVTYHRLDDGVFVGATDGEAPSHGHVRRARQLAIETFVRPGQSGVLNTDGTDYVALSGAGRRSTARAGTRCLLVGYAIRFDGGYPTERRYSVSPNAPPQARRDRIRDALAEAERGVVTDDNRSVVAADPGWGDPVSLQVDEAAVEANEADVSWTFDYFGRFEYQFAVYGGRETDEGDREFGCVLGVRQVPGEAMASVDHEGFSAETVCTISPRGANDRLTLLDWAPNSDHSGGWFGSVGLDSISIGARSTVGAAGEVAVSASDTAIAAQYDTTNFGDDTPVETVFDITGHDEDQMQQLGTAAVFVTNPRAESICSAEIECEFHMAGIPASDTLGGTTSVREI